MTDTLMADDFDGRQLDGTRLDGKRLNGTMKININIMKMEMNING
jgi:hypothetical protein